ncbi:MAG: peptidoglycan editing factor PgeF [Rickettsia sp.]|nr:peptidoglycan editing factor PgeF [Rickettsia sp.]
MNFYINKNFKFFWQFFDKSHEFLQKNLTFKEKLQYLVKKFQTDKLITLKQTHSSKVIDLDKIDINITNIFPEYEGDAIITSKTNIAISVKTADCVPVLLFCKKLNIIAAVHCGWRGSFIDIIKNTTSKMKKKGCYDIYAIIGPAIQKESYIVQKDFFKKFTEKNNYFQKFFDYNKNNETRFDLPNFVKYKLLMEKVKIFQFIKEDTFSMPNKYPSYRYKKENLEHMLSVIFIKSRNENF